MNKLILIALSAMFSMNANATDMLFIACYGTGQQMGMNFDPVGAGAGYQYESVSTKDYVEAIPSGWGQQFSKVTIEGDDSRKSIRAQIIGGDPETPIITLSAKVIVQRDIANGNWILEKAEVYHLDRQLRTQDFVGHHCYVQ